MGLRGNVISAARFAILSRNGFFSLYFRKGKSMSAHHGILLHVVFSTKYRKRLLLDAWRGQLLSYIGSITIEHEATLVKGGGIEDHLHLLLKIHPNFSISSTIRALKANSSRWINTQGKTDKPFRWQRGYGAFSVSQSMSEIVKNYIENQRKHHRKLTFQEEYLAILQKHNVKFDPRFVFEEEIVA